ncbi:hypothetical protein MN116_000565 [Schistosoma mekongi]|uniref:ZSWIM1/3 RNaseH-like domain-containing protein n=1 Tax=Schistosoma mekongi TaxID=38744 RepID=A0AAE1ZJ61_SCHME|nr:hypothetical protein MN116_000565 [Schistosoma mekongi]
MSYVVFFMKTYRWPLYQFVITDGFGRGRTVLFALMRTEKRTDIKQILQSFKNIMGDTSKTTTFTVDCEPGQLRALNEEFPRASIILCLFHICQSFRKKIYYAIVNAGPEIIMFFMSCLELSVKYWKQVPQ